ncbi:MAG: hypothetical protein V4485_02440 [Pseudomonadota bacterium]
MPRALSILFIYFSIFVITVSPLALTTSMNINGEMMPNLALCIVYFCSVQCRVGIWQIFLYGIFTSEIYGTPLGVDSLLFTALYLILVKYRAILLSQKPLPHLIVFTWVVILFNILQYLIISEYYNYHFDLVPILIQTITTILFYPAIQLIMERLVYSSEAAES